MENFTQRPWRQYCKLTSLKILIYGYIVAIFSVFLNTLWAYVCGYNVVSAAMHVRSCQVSLSLMRRMLFPVF